MLSLSTALIDPGLKERPLEPRVAGPWLLGSRFPFLKGSGGKGKCVLLAKLGSAHWSRCIIFHHIFNLVPQEGP